MSDDEGLRPHDVFAEQFRRYAQLRGISDGAIRLLVGSHATSDAVVTNWRLGRTLAPLEVIPIISRALGMGGEAAGEDDPTFILRAMGLLSIPRTADIASTAYNVQRLELKQQKLRNEIGRLDRTGGAAEITRIALDSTKWAVAIWPITAGPLECRMHVEDRIDLRPVSGEPVDNATVFDDPLWHDVLRRTHAIPNKHRSRWSGSDGGLSTWTISHVLTPTLPVVRTPTPPARSICIYGINIDSGANEVGKLVSIALGYGFTLTRDEAMEQMGIPAWLGATEWIPRSRAHQNHLDDPPPAVVWAHHAPPKTDVNPDPFTASRPDVPVFWLRESTELFRQYCDRWPQAKFDDLIAFRRQLDRMAVRNANVTVIDVDLTRTLDRTWSRHIDTATDILRHPTLQPALESAEPSWAEFGRADREVAAPFLSWLRARRP